MKIKSIVKIIGGIIGVIIFAVVVGVLISSILNGAGKAINDQNYDKEIVSFHYDYGSYNGGFWEYDIYIEENNTYIEANGQNGVDLRIDKQIDDSVLEDISTIINENEIYKWYGFDKRNTSIYDGYSFLLEVEYEDGEKASAKGYMSYPKNYDEGHEVLSNYLENIQ